MWYSTGVVASSWPTRNRHQGITSVSCKRSAVSSASILPPQRDAFHCYSGQQVSATVSRHDKRGERLPTAQCPEIASSYLASREVLIARLSMPLSTRFAQSWPFSPWLYLKGPSDDENSPCLRGLAPKHIGPYPGLFSLHTIDRDDLSTTSRL
jgi:hypothetical protein